MSADAADWIATVVAERCPNAVRGADPFHVVAWATEALDQVRRDAWNAARGGKGQSTQESKALKKARWALWRNPEDLTEAQQAKLTWLTKTHPRVHRAWALKEGLRMGIHPGPPGRQTGRQGRPAPVALVGAALPYPRLRGPGSDG